MGFDVNVLGTGSSGNSIMIDDSIMIDAGLGYRTLKDYGARADAIMISHQHGDHINMSFVRRMIDSRPVFMRNKFFINESTRQHIRNKLSAEYSSAVDRITPINDESSFDVTAKSGQTYHVETYRLSHDVENQGFVITNGDGEKLIHATDTETMRFAPRDKYDTLLVEGNWDEDKFIEMVESEDRNENMRALRNLRHLSVQSFETFVRNNSHSESHILQLHASMELGSTSLIGSDFETIDALKKLKK